MLLGVVVIVVALMVWAVLAALAAKSRLEAARDDLNAVRSSPDLTFDDVTARLQHDLRRAQHAQDLLDQPGPSFAAHLPLVGRSFVAERTVADASVEAIAAGLAATQDAQGLGRPGRVDLDRLAIVQQDLAEHSARLTPALDRLAHLNTALTPSPVGHGVTRAQQVLLGLDDDLERAAALAGALHGMLGGDGTRPVLVALENNAELRGTGGLVSTFATGTVRDGALHLGPFRDVVSVSDPPDAVQRVPAPAAYTKAYGPYLANTTLWKNTNMDPDVPTSAAVLARVAQRSTGVRPAVVIFLDAPAMAGIVGHTSPVTVEGRRLGSSQLVKALLVDAYGSGGNDAEEQAARRHRLESAATSAVDRLRHARASIGLVRELARLADGRHLALWSADPGEERALVRAGVAGSVAADGGDVALVSVTNLGDPTTKATLAGSGNKLDYYAKRTVDVHVVVAKDTAQVTETLTLANLAPAGLKSYVEGPYHPGRLHELVSLATARDATLESFTRDGRSVPVARSTENGSQRITFVSDLQRGTQGTWTLTYSVPIGPDGYRLRLIPQPLASPATLHLSVVGAGGATLDWLQQGLDVTDGRILLDEDWRTAHVVAVRTHRRHGWAAFKHDVSDFWTKKVG